MVTSVRRRNAFNPETTELMNSAVLVPCDSLMRTNGKINKIILIHEFSEKSFLYMKSR